ncbi:MAG: hypothetical protein Q4B42_04535 [Oscillospiraceae bacterium]|nr:hypothetical protein [Oscillospiraceae bacterium]
MRCPNCNAETDAGAARCAFCGAALNNEDAAPAETPLPEAAESREPLNQPTGAAPEESPLVSEPEPGASSEPAHAAQTAEKPKKEVSLEDLKKPVGTLKFFLVMLIEAVPVLNIIMLFKWAFGWGVNMNLRNLARGQLLFLLLALIAALALWILAPEFYTWLGGLFPRAAV